MQTLAIFDENIHIVTTIVNGKNSIYKFMIKS